VLEFFATVIQEPDEELRAQAADAAESLGLPLTVVATGDHGLEQALARARADEPLRARAGVDPGRLDADDATERLDFVWHDWNNTGYRERQKTGLDVLADTYRDLAP